MPSLRPSQYAMQQRIDDGPFLRFDLEDTGALSEEELSAIESDDEYQSIGEEIYGISRIY